MWKSWSLRAGGSVPGVVVGGGGGGALAVKNDRGVPPWSIVGHILKKPSTELED